RNPGHRRQESPRPGGPPETRPEADWEKRIPKSCGFQSFTEGCYDCPRKRNCSMEARFPEAVRAHPLGPLASVMHEMTIMLFWLLPAGIAFLLALWALMIYKGLGGRMSLEVALRASLRIGLAVYLFMPLYQLPYFVLGSGYAAGIIGLSL